MDNDKFNQLCTDVEVMKNKLDSFIQYVNEDISTKNEDHETRLRSLEKYRWMLVGGIAILSFIIGHILFK